MTSPGRSRLLGSTTFRFAVATSTLGIALGGWGGTAGAQGTARIHPFHQIEVGTTHLRVAADGRSAIVRVTTNPRTVCAIAYGKTPSLGSIADDPNMGGTAISRHRVALGGLAPGTTYYYRITATDARGRVFQSRHLARFTTPRGAETRAHDVAIGARVLAVSSQWSNAYKGTNAVDGNLSMQWASNGNGDHAFITIELKRRYKISGVAFVTRRMADGTAITRTFAVVSGHRRYGPFAAGSPRNPRIARVSFEGRVLRFEVVTSTGGNTGADEIEVFASGS